MVTMMSSIFWTFLYLHGCFYLWNVSGQEVDEHGAAHCKTIVDIVIVLDSSGSVRLKYWPLEVDFAKELVKLLTVGEKESHVGVIDFSTRAVVNVELNKKEGHSSASIQSTLDTLKSRFQSGVTYIDYAFIQAKRMFNQVPKDRDVPKLLVVVTDGKATKRRGISGFNHLKPHVDDLKLANVNIIAIGVGKRVNMEELRYIATNASEVITVEKFQVLKDKIKGLLVSLCPLPVIIEENEELDDDKCGTIDLVFVLDCSGSIGRTEWGRELGFLKKLLENFTSDATVSLEKTHIGLLVFHENVTEYLEISHDGSSMNKVFSTIENMKTIWRPHMRTYTDLAIQKVVEVFQNAPRNFPKIVLLLTDGETSFWRKDELSNEIPKLESKGIKMYGVGVGPFVNYEELSKICKGRDNVFAMKNYNKADGVISKISAKLCRAGKQQEEP